MIYIINIFVIKTCWCIIFCLVINENAFEEIRFNFYVVQERISVIISKPLSLLHYFVFKADIYT